MGTALDEGVEPQWFAPGIDKQELAVLVEDVEAMWQGAARLVPAQQVSAKRVQRAHLHRLDVHAWQLLLDAVLEFQRGLVGEGGDEQMLRRDQQRAAGVQDGVALLGGQKTGR